MPNIYSFLQTAYHFVKSLVVSVTKKMYRTAAVLFTGLTVVTVVSFNSSSFAGAGKTAAAAYHENNDEEEKLPDMMQSEEVQALELTWKFCLPLQKNRGSGL